MRWKIVEKKVENGIAIFTLLNKDTNEQNIWSELNLIHLIQEENFYVTNCKISKAGRILITQDDIKSPATVFKKADSPVTNEAEKKQKLKQFGYQVNDNISLADNIHNIVLELVAQVNLGLLPDGERADTRFFHDMYTLYPMSEILHLSVAHYDSYNAAYFDKQSQTLWRCAYKSLDAFKKYPEFAKVVNPNTLIILLQSFEEYYKYNNVHCVKAISTGLEKHVGEYLNQTRVVKLEKSVQDKKYWDSFSYPFIILDATEVDDTDVMLQLIDSVRDANWYRRRFKRVVFDKKYQYYLIMHCNFDSKIVKFQ